MGRPRKMPPPPDVQSSPKCFATLHQFRMWLQAASVTGGCFDTGFCTDCTPEYKQRMLAQNRCEHPEIQFGFDLDGFIQGMLNEQANNPNPAA